MSDKDSKFTYQPIRFSHEQEQWLETMQELNGLLAEMVVALQLTPAELGELRDINLYGHESREEAYRKRFL